MSRRCDECRGWDGSEAHDTNENSGICRVNAPVAAYRTGLARWPFTDGADWCGLFRAEDPESCSRDLESKS